jgi:DhnA family fructose-bisphosphate aldolase class Ia
MMHTGIERRMARLFAADGRSLILAFDHGGWGANYAGMADPAHTLADAVAAGADAVLTTVGQALRFGKSIDRIGLVINLDIVVGDPTYAVKQALSVGADMGKVISYPWSLEDPDSVARAARLSAICRAYHLPLMIEPIPVSFEHTAEHTPEKIGQAARQGAEIGADLLKIQYTGDVASFRKVLAPLFVPAVVLGGPSQESIHDVLANVHGAMEAGAVGIAIGRNIWAHPTPAKVIAAMATIVHGNGTLQQAMRELG